ncbi:MAG: transmembrane domain-containing protein [Gemmatimonadales bacterium]|nr:transmembrane domain-containing protein [Gemmatimonadales bacterium]
MRRPLFCLAVLALLAGCAPDLEDSIVAPPPPPPITAPLWSEASTWAPLPVPALGADVVVPADKTVILDVSPPPLGKVVVEGTLTVLPTAEIRFVVNALIVRGTFQVGTEAAPHRQAFTLTLTGADPGTEAMTDKAIAVFPGGTLDIHGEPRTGWTRLTETAAAGTTQLRVQDGDGWRAGDRLVVASTDFDPGEAEEVEVERVAASTITLRSALRHEHFGVQQTIAGRVVDERAEVGLLTRNIRIEGDSQSVGGYGGHVIILPGGTARIEGASFYRMGQAGKLARYPIHWHLAGDVTGQYVRDAAIWRTNNRCITIHGTDGALARGNVCYDHLGHGYFLEDGAESGNTIDRNLGLVARVPSAAVRLLASDATPSTFWITNPDNIVTGNAAAGSVGFGFWYALPAAPTGLSTGQPDVPRRTPLGAFRDNVAHSNRRPGLNVDDGPKPDGTTETTSYQPRAGAAAGGVLVAAVFQGFTGYKHTGRAVWLRGREHRLSGAVLADNMIGATFASSDTRVESSLIVGESDNRTAAPNASFPIRGYEFYDGTVGAMDVTFANFTPNGTRPASALGYNRSNGFPISQDNFGAAIRLVNANAAWFEAPRADKDGDKASLFRDLDGSVTGAAGTTVVTNLPFLVTPACTFQSSWNAWHCPFRFNGLQVLSETTEPVAPLTIRRDDAISTALVGVPNNPKSASISVQAGRQYSIEWSGPAPSRPRITLQRGEVGDAIQIALPYPAGTFRVVRDFSSSQPVPLAASLADASASQGDRYWYDTATGMLHVVLHVRANRTSTTIQVIPG